MTSNKNLAYWKGAHAKMCMLRDALKLKYQMYAKAAEKARRTVESIEGKVLVGFALLILLVGGCQTFRGMREDSAWTLRRMAEGATPEAQVERE